MPSPLQSVLSPYERPGYDSPHAHSPSERRQSPSSNYQSSPQHPPSNPAVPIAADSYSLEKELKLVSLPSRPTAEQDQVILHVFRLAQVFCEMSEDFRSNFMGEVPTAVLTEIIVVELTRRNSGPLFAATAVLLLLCRDLQTMPSYLKSLIHDVSASGLLGQVLCQADDKEELEACLQFLGLVLKTLQKQNGLGINTNDLGFRIVADGFWCHRRSHTEELYGLKMKIKTLVDSQVEFRDLLDHAYADEQTREELHQKEIHRYCSQIQDMRDARVEEAAAQENALQQLRAAHQEKFDQYEHQIQELRDQIHRQEESLHQSAKALANSSILTKRNKQLQARTEKLEEHNQLLEEQCTEMAKQLELSSEELRSCKVAITNKEREANILKLQHKEEVSACM